MDKPILIAVVAVAGGSMASVRPLLLLCLCALLTGAVQAPPPPHTTAEQEEQLGKDHVVVTTDMNGESERGVRGRAIAEVDAAPDKVWQALLDFPARVAENAALRTMTQYQADAWKGEILTRAARWELKVLGIEVVFNTAYEYDRSQSYLEWHLDKAQHNDIVFSWGSYQVLPSPLHPGRSRLVYTSESDSGRATPLWLRKKIAISGLKGLVEGIRRRSEGN